MTDFLIYDAKVAVLIVVFYMFYRLFRRYAPYFRSYPPVSMESHAVDTP